MPVQTFNYTTGPTTLQDVGQLFYNGCTFGPLVESTISGQCIEDEANRTVKYLEITLTVDGYVTAPNPAVLDGIAPTMNTLYDLLTAQAGALVYNGRGFDLSVNQQGANLDPVSFGQSRLDVAWGPVPKLLDFVPLGEGLSAKIRWQVVVRLVRYKAPVGAKGKPNFSPLLQFCYETTVGYSEDYYSTISFRGVMEIPLTRVPSQSTRTFTTTVDDQRNQIETRLFAGVDLSRFYVTKRNFDVSYDKRLMRWNFELEEKPYMDQPADCAIARGTYGVRPAKVGMGLCTWLCSLRITYTVRKDRPRRTAWFAFLMMLRHRMAASQLGNLPQFNGDQNPPRDNRANLLDFVTPQYRAAVLFWRQFFANQNKEVKNAKRAFLVDFQFDEGVHRDSKVTSFSSTWQLVTTFDSILRASGLWRKLPEVDQQGNNIWSTSMKDVSGSQSWLVNAVDSSLDVVVDFGGG
jgi:hypothetical protein